MKIIFTEDVVLTLHADKPRGRRIKKRFNEGEVCVVEFLGEDSDLNGIDFRIEDEWNAINVPRCVIGILKDSDYHCGT